MKSRKKIGIALSGGGARGVSHLGVLKALNEKGIFPNRVSGTSAGAIVGSMYCEGYTPDAIFDIIVQTKYFKFLRPAVSLVGILKMEILEKLFSQYLEHNDFSKLKIPLTIAATDICRGKAVYFSEGEIIRAIMASSCIPGMFDPILIDGEYYVDGGVLNNLPVEPLDGVCDVIIGVNCNHLPEQPNIKNIKTLIERTVIMSMNFNSYSRKEKCDYFIEPTEMARFGAFDIKRAKDIFTAGYEGGLEYIENTPSLLNLVSAQ
ncbi:patatin-like phospholipase family protein [Litoribacter ruber]|uniref:Patatin-like phospholipase family protein n=1 Tax=Litoribacter ruber TaxID=702568 RepID=A0AAP2CJ48_9BACT|nr:MULTISPECIES: patatin-like phospholipase family protein [Litoribacter]MBS9524649.1 patatin-like phospholipase family protein [Litoribacter alkaliphilus]MBT0810192.1 patatin-like phospholipase family protein [Litoribacter ruber]